MPTRTPRRSTSIAAPKGAVPFRRRSPVSRTACVRNCALGCALVRPDALAAFDRDLVEERAVLLVVDRASAEIEEPDPAERLDGDVDVLHHRFAEIQVLGVHAHDR